MSHALFYGFVLMVGLAAGTLSGIIGTGLSIVLLPVLEGFLATSWPRWIVRRGDIR